MSRALARERQKELLDDSRVRERVSSALVRRTRRSVGAALVLAGTRLMARDPSVADLLGVRASGADDGGSRGG